MIIISDEHKKYLKRLKINKFIINFIKVSILISFLITWEALAHYNLINTFLTSYPKEIAKTFIELLKNNNLLEHILTTTYEVLISFILGTAIVFTIIGIVCAVTGTVFASAFGAYFTLIIASLLLIMGLKLLGFLDFEIPTIIKAMPQNRNNSIFLYPVLLGITFALAGTPCSTPILAGIMAFAAIGKNIGMAILMLFLFAVGQGVIIIIAGLFTSGLKNMKSMACVSECFLKVSGILLALVAFYMYWRVFNSVLV